jgi:N-acetyl-anhydromuramyl-L-alanine amidase AmpD
VLVLGSLTTLNRKTTIEEVALVNIINVNYSWKSQPIARKATIWIVVHHTGTTSATVEGIHRHHQDVQGWNGFGYHAYIRKDGRVFSGRPFGTVGAHCRGYNHNSIGICFEGNFEKEQMTQAQVDKGIELLKYLNKMYPEARITRHKDLNNDTLCPGRNFVDDIIIKAYEVEPKIDPLAAKKEMLSKLREPTELKPLIDRLLQIYQNIDKLPKEYRIVGRSVLRK